MAEGIENTEQLELLKSSGCTMGQGYLFSQAVNMQRAKQMLTQAI